MSVSTMTTKRANLDLNHFNVTLLISWVALIFGAFTLSVYFPQHRDLIVQVLSFGVMLTVFAAAMKIYRNIDTKRLIKLRNFFSGVAIVSAITLGFIHFIQSPDFLWGTPQGVTILLAELAIFIYAGLTGNGK